MPRIEKSTETEKKLEVAQDWGVGNGRGDVGSDYSWVRGSFLGVMKMFDN